LEADGLKSSLGKLLVYAPKTASCRKRLMVVKAAVEKTAKALNMDFEIVSFKGNTPIYVYYEAERQTLCRSTSTEKARKAYGKCAMPCGALCSSCHSIRNTPP